MLYFLTGRMCFCVQSAVRTCCGVWNYQSLCDEIPFHTVCSVGSVSAGTAASVAGNYDFTPDRRMVIVTLDFYCIICADLPFFEKRPAVFPGK